MRHETIERIIERVRIAEIDLRSGAREDDRTFLQARATLNAALTEITDLHEHECQWSDDDWCVLCGADGRA